MDADDFDVLDRGQRLHHLAQPPRRQHQRIAAGEDDLPDFCMLADIIERRRKRRAIERAGLARPDHFAAEAEAAIDRANLCELEQHAVRIAMHDARHRRMGIIADWIGKLLRARIEFSFAGDELPRDRVVRIVTIDQIGKRAR